MTVYKPASRVIIRLFVCIMFAVDRKRSHDTITPTFLISIIILIKKYIIIKKEP